ncbi:MAG: NTP transferase domain-containing protein [Deltaproteobacteria bacterium]|nr:NTP transferase domain-containing protein [Deltaproteobacteria bacterium]
MQVVILAGGSGTRFWPLSRHQRPKQLLPLVGSRTTLELTVERLLPLVPATRMTVITNRAQAPAVAELLAPWLGPGQIIAEPRGRNTAPAIALAARLLVREGGAGTMLVCPADHYIGAADIFRETLATAARVAAAGWLVTLGITPSRPETGYGYIQAGEPLPAGDWPAETARKVARFVEKPDRQRASEYLAAGNFYWNSGIFLWRPEVILDEISRHLPGIAACLDEFDRRRAQDGLDEALNGYFAAVEAISIDYGVLEKSSRVAVIPGNFAWSDLGSWDALDELGLRPAGLESETIAVEAANNAVFSDKPTALVGVKDLLVVDTPDALLICRKGRSQQVREVVARLQEQGREDLL